MTAWPDSSGGWTPGLDALAEEGAAGLKIDRLTRRLGVTKGSFFHHFAGAAAYQTALLAHLEATAVAQIEAREGELETADPRPVLGRMTAAVGDSTYGLWRADLEVALRAWSFSDPEVRATQDRIDRRRLAMLEADLAADRAGPRAGPGQRPAAVPDPGRREHERDRPRRAAAGLRADPAAGADGTRPPSPP